MPLPKQEIQKIESKIFGAFTKDKLDKKWDYHVKMIELWHKLDKEDLSVKIQRAALLFVWYEMKYFELAGYDTFQDFCNSGELGLRFGYHRATRYISAYRFIQDNAISEEELTEKLGSWSQLEEIVPAINSGHITKENFGKFIDDIKDLTTKDVRQSIRELKGDTEADTKKCDHPFKIIVCPKCEMRVAPKKLELKDGSEVLAFVIKKL